MTGTGSNRHELVDAKEAAEICGVRYETIHVWHREHKLPHVWRANSPKGKVLFARADVEAIAAQRATA